MGKTKTMKKLYKFIFLSNIKLSNDLFYEADWIAESELPLVLKLIYVWLICQIQRLTDILNNFLLFIDERFFTENLISIEEVRQFGINPERNFKLEKKYQKYDVIDKNQ